MKNTVAMVLCVGLCCEFAAAQKEITAAMTFYGGPGKSTGYLSLVGLSKLLNENLADAQQFNMYLDMCQSGAMIDVADGAKTKLTMPFVLSTAGKGLADTTDWNSPNDTDPASRLKVGDFYYAGYTAMMAKRLKEAPVPSVQGLHDDVRTRVRADPLTKKEDPQWTTGNMPDTTLKINAGTNKKHALIMAGNTGKLSTNLTRELARSVTALNYDTTKFYWNSYAPGSYTGYTITDSGEFDQLKSYLAAMKTTLAADRGKQTVSIFFRTHGALDSKDAKNKLGALPNTPKQGIEYAGGPGGTVNSTSVLADARVWDALKEGVTQNLPDLERIETPEFYLAYSEATFNPGATLDIAIGGVTIAEDIALLTSPTPGLIRVELDDASLLQIIALNDGLPELAIDLTMSEGASLRIATIDDMLFDPLYDLPLYGLGILTVANPPEVPAPAGLALLLGSLIATRRRRA